MKPFPVIALLTSGAVITGIAAAAGIAPTFELKLLIFINIIVILAILLRKRLQLYQWFHQTKKVSPSAGTTISNTSWFVTNRLGLKRLPLEESMGENTLKKNRTAEIDKIAAVIEPIDSITGNGKVKYKGMNWRARSLTGEKIARGERVVIVTRDVLTLVVDRIKKT